MLYNRLYDFILCLLGTTVAMVGAFQTAGTAIPFWTCLLNGNTYNSTAGPFIFDLGAVNTTVLCQFQNITTSPSNLTVVASGTTGTPFLFSHIEYAPAASTILNNATVAIFPLDRQIQYGSGWNKLDPNDYQVETSTQLEGATMAFDFVGARPCSFKYFFQQYVYTIRRPNSMDNKPGEQF